VDVYRFRKILVLTLRQKHNEIPPPRAKENSEVVTGLAVLPVAPFLDAANEDTAYEDGTPEDYFGKRSVVSAGRGGKSNMVWEIEGHCAGNASLYRTGGLWVEYGWFADLWD